MLSLLILRLYSEFRFTQKWGLGMEGWVWRTRAEWVTWRDLESENYGTNLTVISGPESTGCTQVFCFGLVLVFWTTQCYLEQCFLRKETQTTTTKNPDEVANLGKVQIPGFSWNISLVTLGPELQHISKVLEVCNVYHFHFFFFGLALQHVVS